MSFAGRRAWAPPSVCRRPPPRRPDAALASDRMGPEDVERFAAAASPDSATVRRGRPHLVPSVFIVIDGVVWSACRCQTEVDRWLQRRPFVADSRVSLLVDRRRRLGAALVGAMPTARRRSSTSVPREPRLRSTRWLPSTRSTTPIVLPGPLVAVTVMRWSAWSHSTTVVAADRASKPREPAVSGARRRTLAPGAGAHCAARVEGVHHGQARAAHRGQRVRHPGSQPPRLRQRRAQRRRRPSPTSTASPSPTSRCSSTATRPRQR